MESNKVKELEKMIREKMVEMQSYSEMYDALEIVTEVLDLTEKSNVETRNVISTLWEEVTVSYEKEYGATLVEKGQ